MESANKRSVGCGIATIGMTPSTKGFLQKICYKVPASVDMTRFGFICDSKVRPVNLLLKPLREKLGEICAQSSQEKGKSSRRRRAKRSSPHKSPTRSRRPRPPSPRPPPPTIVHRIPHFPKVPSPPFPSKISVIRKASSNKPPPARQPRVTFEDPHVTEMRFNKPFQRW